MDEVRLANLPIDNYTEIKLVVDSVTITLANKFNVSAMLSNNAFKVAILRGLDVRNGSSQYLTISIEPHVFETNNGTLILKLLIKAKASNKPLKNLFMFSFVHFPLVLVDFALIPPFFEFRKLLVEIQKSDLLLEG